MKVKNDNLTQNLQKILLLFLILRIGYLLVFLVIRNEWLISLNLASIAIYLFTIFLSKRKLLGYAFFILHIETMIHTSICIFVLGWDYGFDIAIIALLFIIYIDIFQNKFISYILVFMDFMVYITLYIITFDNTAYYPKIYSTYFFLVNFLFFILILLVISKILNFTDAIHFLELKKDKEKFKYMSEVDYLTGLLNKRALKLITDDKKYSSMIIAMCDIDNFKRINDIYGHNIGDRVLKKISEIFINLADKNDIVCRAGGEEIIVVSFDMPKNKFLLKIQNIRNEINKSIIHASGENIKFTMTFGISECGSDQEELIKQADTRLYKGKQSTKNCIVVK
ncbi:diguanylate cyclase [Campylobacter iguaniorum]|nr:diguanylate cyclase [Campylobacter iguaniorum]